MVDSRWLICHEAVHQTIMQCTQILITAELPIDPKLATLGSLGYEGHCDTHPDEVEWCDTLLVVFVVE